MFAYFPNIHQICTEIHSNWKPWTFHLFLIIWRNISDKINKIERFRETYISVTLFFPNGSQKDIFSLIVLYAE